ncbi:hypothetical protein HJFPF1_13223 [Paramyrothecium foliicola]|nr:hypothetical protein HJFPF1_13223 [Paramyrothecium foliicola]
MDAPSFIVPPAAGGDIRESNSMVGDPTSFPPQALPLNSTPSLPQKPLHEVPLGDNKKNEEHSGPLKQMVNPDSLYKYTNWEDPARTIGSYVFIMSALLGAHYLPLTQTALKVGATTLGVAATVEYAHRSFTDNTILARLRPKEYKKIPEPVLNDTLKDIHDLVQYLVVEAQKVILGQDLERTFAGFISLSALYWLVKMLSPFALVLLSVTMLYIAPLARTPRGREVMEDARIRATNLGNAALENSQALANDGKAKASELTTKAQETAADAKRRAGELAQSGSQSAADMSGHVKDTLSDMSGTAAENVSALPQMGKDVMNKASNNTNAALGSVNQQVQSTLPERFQTGSQKVMESYNTNDTKNDHGSDMLFEKSNTTNATTDDRSFGEVTSERAPPAYEESSMSGTGFNAEKHTSSTIDARDSHYELKGTSSGLKDVMQSTPRQTAGNTLTNLTDTMPGVASEGDQAGVTGVMGRPRGVPLANLDGSPGFGKHMDTEL